GFDALLEPGAQDVPFGGVENARQHVEGNEALLGVRFAIDCKSDADAPEQDLRLAPAIVQHIRRHIGEPAKQLAVGGPQASIVAFHLVERDHHRLPPLVRPPGQAAPAILAARRAPTQAYSGADAIRIVLPLPMFWAAPDEGIIVPAPARSAITAPGVSWRSRCPLAASRRDARPAVAPPRPVSARGQLEFCPPRRGTRDPALSHRTRAAAARPFQEQGPAAPRMAAPWPKAPP